MFLARQGKKILPTRYTIFLININLTRKNRSSVFNDAQIIGNIKSTDRFKQLDLSFENSEIAYKSKTNFELIRALFVFYSCSVKFIVDNQIKVNYFRKT
jgi:hypothetical protein